MASRAVILLLIAAWSPALLAQAPARDAPPATSTAAIRGRVIAAGADRPLSRVEVRAACPPLRVDKAVLTDANGRYEIGDLPAGRYTIAFSRTNYVRASFGQRRPLGPGTSVDVATGAIVTGIDAALQRSSVITGRILDEYGDPMTGAQVMPMRPSYLNGERRLQQAGMTAVSNDLGEYRIFGLVPGRYAVSAVLRSAGYTGTPDRAYTPTYYPGTPNPAAAQRLTIAPGQTVPAINLTILPAAALRVSGVAFDSRGRPMAGANVNLSQRIGSGIYSSSYGQVRSDGTFAIGGVAPGDYSAHVSLAGVQDEIAAADITVSNADVTGVQLIAVKLSTIRGRVAFEPGGTKPPAFNTVRMILTHPDSLSAVNANLPLGRDGTFELTSSAGRARLNIGPALVDWRLKRVLAPDGSDVTDAGFEVPSGSTVDGFVVELTSHHGQVSGTVVDAAGALVRDYVVLVFAQDPERWSGQTRYIQVGRPDQDSAFSVRLPAGDYLAAAFELDDQFVSLNDPDILQQLRDRATKVSIADGEKRTLPLTLVEPPIF